MAVSIRSLDGNLDRIFEHPRLVKCVLATSSSENFQTRRELSHCLNVFTKHGTQSQIDHMIELSLFEAFLALLKDGDNDDASIVFNTLRALEYVF